jgi:hypothetical protein
VQKFIPYKYWRSRSDNNEKKKRESELRTLGLMGERVVVVVVEMGKEGNERENESEDGDWCCCCRRSSLVSPQ